ncbi:MAG TPA: glutamyl-tRNA reductase [Pyrinomonadaceae bacterium]|nr:glutamyl-tRNA reductase [Pyrinomonadaceae bacterium]
MPEDKAVLFAVGLNHRTAPVDVRERIYLHADEIPPIISKLKETLDEVVVLSTCNRTEVYGVTSRLDLDLDFYKDLLIDFKRAGEHVTREHFFGSVSCAACQQLFKVATSLDSRIVGDAQILGQLRDAYALAKYHQATGKITNQLFQRSFKIGKQTRHETSLHKGAISVSVAAVEFAERYFGELSDRSVLLIGAGDTSRLAAEALVKRRVGKLTVANRTIAHAEEMIAALRKADVETRAVGLDTIRSELKRADVVISSIAASEPILTGDDVAGIDRGILLIDLGVPRNISADVSDHDGVLLKNIDELNEIVEANYKKRLDNVPHARGIIKDGMTDFLIWYYSLPLLPASIKCGAKPDAITQKEIVGVKNFLMKNLSWVHKLAMNSDADTFAGHVAVVDELVARRKAAARAAG